jgi:hypothetical protein
MNKMSLVHGTIYKLNFDDGTCYIGSTKRTVKQRLESHVYRHITKSIEILESVDNICGQCLRILERKYVDANYNNLNRRRPYINPDELHALHKYHDLKRSPHSPLCDPVILEKKRQSDRAYKRRHSEEYKHNTERKEDIKIRNIVYRMHHKYGTVAETERPWVMLMPFQKTTCIA